MRDFGCMKILRDVSLEFNKTFLLARLLAQIDKFIIMVLLKELGLLFSVLILQIRPSIFKKIFWRFLAHFLNFVKKNQNSLKGVFLTFLARFLMSKKTQDVFGGFSSIFS